MPGNEVGTRKSALLALEGEGAQAFAAGWEGPIQWIGGIAIYPFQAARRANRSD